MNSQRLWLQVSEAVGAVSAEYIVPVGAKAMLTLAHGAGAGMDHPFMVELSRALAKEKFASLRFNFPFIENKKRRADIPHVAHASVEAAINHAHRTYPSLPIFAAGKSFGSRMSSQYLALHQHPAVQGIIFYGFPLHPAGQPSIDRAEHLKNVQIPMLFLQGTRDALATLSLIETVCALLPKATLIKIEGADHAFKAGKTDIIQLLAESTCDWVKSKHQI